MLKHFLALKLEIQMIMNERDEVVADLSDEKLL
jgi:hypothetical protein